MDSSPPGDMGQITFTFTQLEQIASLLVSDRDSHRVLDGKFQHLNIKEPSPDPSPEEGRFKKLGMRAGVDYYNVGPSKRDRLRYAVQEMYNRSRGRGVLYLVQVLHDPVSYVDDPDEFAQFCHDINLVLRFSGWEYRDDGQFHRVVETRTLSEAEQRTRRLANRLSARRVHPEVQKYCKAEYMEENYFHAVFEASKGLAERVRDLTDLQLDGVNLLRQSFERPKNGLPKLVFNSLDSETERNEHDGFTNLLIGTFQMFRNPIAHTPRVKWQRDIEDAVDCLTLISFLHVVLDECHQVPTGHQE